MLQLDGLTQIWSDRYLQGFAQSCGLTPLVYQGWIIFTSWYSYEWDSLLYRVCNKAYLKDVKDKMVLQRNVESSA